MIARMRSRLPRRNLRQQHRAPQPRIPASGVGVGGVIGHPAGPLSCKAANQERGLLMKSTGCTILVLVLLAVAGRQEAAIAQDTQQLESYLRLHYVKHEHMIPMRDGVKLFTAVFVPRDTTRSYPILMKRTPYSCAPYGEDKYPAKVGPSEHFVKARYIFVNQDVRGRFSSEGQFVQV